MSRINYPDFYGIKDYSFHYKHALNFKIDGKYFIDKSKILYEQEKKGGNNILRAMIRDERLHMTTRCFALSLYPAWMLRYGMMNRNAVRWYESLLTHSEPRIVETAKEVLEWHLSSRTMTRQEREVKYANR